MKRDLLLLIWLLVGWPGFTAAADGGTALNLQPVAPGIFVHQGIHALPEAGNRGEIANIGFIVGEHCVAVVDPGGSPAQGQALKRAIRELTSVPVCYVINTHAHPDHVYGNRAFKDPGVIFIGHHKLAESMAMRGVFYLERARRDLGLALTAEDFVPPNQAVTVPVDLDLGGRHLTLTPHPTAHTDCDLSIFDHKTATLWLSDLLFIGHIPVIDGSLNGWLKELDRLKTLPAARVIPGHGPVSAEWPQALEPEEEYLKALQTEIRAWIKAGKHLESALEEVGQSQRSRWALFDEFHKRNISTAFAELEWE